MSVGFFCPSHNAEDQHKFVQNVANNKVFGPSLPNTGVYFTAPNFILAHKRDTTVDKSFGCIQVDTTDSYQVYLKPYATCGGSLQSIYYYSNATQLPVIYTELGVSYVVFIQSQPIL